METNGQKIEREIINYLSKIGIHYPNILFMPYKEEMWDSMESVYEAFDNDDNFYGKVDICPMPYYRIGTDGKLDKLCCEFGNDFLNFSPEKINDADAVVIHNPYDKFNMVTQTLLFSRAFKDMGKVLIYIPYFAVGDNLSDNLIHQPGVLNADMIFVESEKQKEIYTNTILKHLHKDISNKIYVCGSPKFDALKKQYAMPMEWFNAKALGKKLILFNTSLVPFLKNPNEKLGQIKHIISEYSQKEDCYLIYRPHPLLEQTIKRLAPTKYEEYMRILDSSYNFYLDKSSCFSRAIVFADELITDPSSLVILWKSTNKPITII